MRHTPTAKELKEWIDACLDNPRHPLTKWEQNFVESVSEQFDAGKRITERQVEVLEQIYAAKTD